MRIHAVQECLGRLVAFKALGVCHCRTCLTVSVEFYVTFLPILIWVRGCFAGSIFDFGKSTVQILCEDALQTCDHRWPGRARPVSPLADLLISNFRRWCTRS